MSPTTPAPRSTAPCSTCWPRGRCSTPWRGRSSRRRAHRLRRDRHAAVPHGRGAARTAVLDRAAGMGTMQRGLGCRRPGRAPATLHARAHRVSDHRARTAGATGTRDTHAGAPQTQPADESQSSLLRRSRVSPTAVRSRGARPPAARPRRGPPPRAPDLPMTTANADARSPVQIARAGLSRGDGEPAVQFSDDRSYDGAFLLERVNLAEQHVELEPADPHARGLPGGWGRWRRGRR